MSLPSEPNGGGWQHDSVGSAEDRHQDLKATRKWFRRYSIRRLLALLALASVTTYAIVWLLTPPPPSVPQLNRVTRITMNGLALGKRTYRGGFVVPKENWAEVLAALEMRSAADWEAFYALNKTDMAVLTIEHLVRSGNVTANRRTQVVVVADDRAPAFIVVKDPLSGQMSVGLAASKTTLMRTIEARYAWMDEAHPE